MARGLFDFDPQDLSNATDADLGPQYDLPQYGGLLDALKPSPVQTSAVKALVDSSPMGFTPAPDAAPAPTLDKAPGLWDRLKTAATTPNDQGFTWGDKLIAVGSSLRGDQQGANAYIDAGRKRQLQTQQLGRQKALSQLFTQSLDAHGRLDPAKWSAGIKTLGGDVDIGDAAEVQKEFGPHNQFINTKFGVFGGDPNDPDSLKRLFKASGGPIKIGGGLAMPDDPDTGELANAPSAGPPAQGGPTEAPQAPAGATLPDQVPAAAQGSAQGPPVAGGPTQAGPQAMNADAVWQKIIQRESGGNGMAVSNQGALGSTQMLPATAQAMAAKLGLPYQPELLQSNDPAALDYQHKLGRAYFDEGVQKYGGDLHKAAAYYHGGPNQAIWGPKTQAYADAVTGAQMPVRGPAAPTQLAAGGGTAPPMQGGAGADQLGAAGGAEPQLPPGYHWVVPPTPRKAFRQLTPEEGAQYGPGRWQEDTSTGQISQMTGSAPKTPAGSGKLSAQAQAAETNSLGALNIASSINTRLQKAQDNISKGLLKFGLVDNAGDSISNFTGHSSPQSRAKANFMADLEKMRNDSLRLNKGTQTEGDAQRAWNEIVSHLNDTDLVRSRLSEISGYNDQAIAFHKDLVGQLREDAGLPPLDTSKFEAKPLPTPGAAAQPAARAAPAPARPAVPARQQWTTGKVYQTPRGPLKRTATGWVRP